MKSIISLFTKVSCLILVSVLFFSFSSGTNKEASAMRVLMICDDFWHPGQIPIDGVAPLAELGFQFEIISNANDFKSGMLSDYPVVLLCKSDQTSQEDRTRWLTDEIQQAFVSYVENGGG